MTEGLTIRLYQDGDEHKILETFNLVFREVCGPEYVDRTLEQWQWAYAKNPAGHRMSLAVAADGTAVKDGVSGFAWFLHVDHTEGRLTAPGCVSTAPNGSCTAPFERRSSDGDDVLFGDLGNDWVVGGTLQRRDESAGLVVQLR